VKPLPYVPGLAVVCVGTLATLITLAIDSSADIWFPLGMTCGGLAAMVSGLAIGGDR